MASDLVIDITPVPTFHAEGIFEGEANPADYVAKQQPPLGLTREEVDGKQVVSVVDRMTGIFGSGSDPKAALEDLRIAKKEHREVLESQSKLSPALKQQLRYLQRR